MSRVTNVLLEFGSLNGKKEMTRLYLKTKKEINLQQVKIKKRRLKTFPETGEAEELNEAEVVSGNEHSGGVIGIHGVDLGYISVFSPNTTDL